MDAAHPVAGAAGQHPAALFTRSVDDTGRPIVLFLGTVLDLATVARSVLLSELFGGGTINETRAVTATDAQVTRWIQHPAMERADNVPTDALWDVLNVRPLMTSDDADVLSSGVIPSARDARMSMLLV